jgi:hypothetical protein
LHKLNTGYEEHTTQTKALNLFHMDDLKLTGKTKEELQKQMQKEQTVTISIWNLDFKSVKSLYFREEN